MNRITENGQVVSAIRRDRYLRSASVIALGGMMVMGAATGGPTPAQAQERGGFLEEIVVSAQFREQNLQTVPLAISAFSGEALEFRGVDDVSDIGDFVPNADFRPNGVQPVIGIRGKVDDDRLVAFSPTVQVYLDDVLHGTLVGSNVNIFDIERVEVLRGPQGTLFGRNSLGGAVRIITQKPEGDNTGYVEGKFGRFQRVDTKGAFDIPLIEDKLNMRATFSSQKADGDITRLDWACEMLRQGRGELAGFGDGLGADGSAGGGFDGEPDVVALGSNADNAFAFRIVEPNSRTHVADQQGATNPADPRDPFRPGPNNRNSKKLCNTGTFRGQDIQGGRLAFRWVGTNNLDVLLTMDFVDENSEEFQGILKQDPNVGAGELQYITGFRPNPNLSVTSFNRDNIAAGLFSSNANITADSNAAAEAAVAAALADDPDLSLSAQEAIRQQTFFATLNNPATGGLFSGLTRVTLGGASLFAGTVPTGIFQAFGILPSTFTGIVAPNVNDGSDPRNHDSAFNTPDKTRTTFEDRRDPVSGPVASNGQDFDLGNNIKSWGINLTMDWDPNEYVHVKSVSSIRRFEADFQGRASRTNGDGTPFDDVDNGGVQAHEQYQQELRLNGFLFDNRLDWTVGGFLFYQNDNEFGEVTLQPIGFLGVFDDPKFKNDNFDTNTQSAFGHLIFEITDQLSLTAGLRWTHEVKSLLFFQPPTLALTERERTKESRADWKVALDYQVNDLTLIYGSVATGFRTGGFNPRPFTRGQLLPFDTEEVTSWEVGFKADLFEQRVRLNVTGFYENYSPRVTQVGGAIQCTDVSSPPEEVGDPVFGTVNNICPPDTEVGMRPEGENIGITFAPFVSSPGDVKGVEVELTANPISTLTVNFALGYNQFTADETDPTSLAFRDKNSLLQPEWNLSGGLQYLLELGNSGSVIPRADWRYKSHSTASDPGEDPPPSEIIHGYHLFDFSLTYQAPQQAWQFRAELRNAFDKFYFIDFSPPTQDFQSALPGLPRTWAFSLRRNF